MAIQLPGNRVSAFCVLLGRTLQARLPRSVAGREAEAALAPRLALDENRKGDEGDAAEPVRRLDDNSNMLKRYTFLDASDIAGPLQMAGLTLKRLAQNRRQSLSSPTCAPSARM